MRRLSLAVATLGLSLGLAACDQASKPDPDAEIASAMQVHVPAGLEPGSNEMLRSALKSDPDHEVLISDVIIPPGAEVPRHFHPGEEFVYVIEGSAVHVEEGKPDRLIKAGDAMVIPPEAVHAPRGGPEGARAIVFRVHVAGQPERIPVPGT
ncbi:cupin domain-containing protein [Altererythrobacter sp.]|uniref:cupin domain-containing protein n=1 Tax=Altererythrobacter sp. TaxID=1872480 RepID=UPI003D018DD7